MGTHSLDTAQRMLEKAAYAFSLNSKEEAKSICLESIKILSKLLKSDSSISSSAKAAMQTYDKIKQNNLLSYEEKLLWLSSEVSASGQCSIFAPPLLLDSVCIFDPSYQEPPLKIPSHKTVKWLKVDELYSKDMKLFLQQPEGVFNLYQDELEDCSFVVALSSVMENGIALNCKIIFSAGSEKFGAILHFNGCDRLVVSDTRLPVSQNGGSLFVQSSLKPDFLWLALLEKAFLKVFGNGYDFPGSNAGLDTFMLTGWFPEFKVISKLTQSDFLDIRKLYKNGQLLMSCGADRHSDKVQEHDYSIVDMIEERDGMKFLVTNPWRCGGYSITQSPTNFAVLYLNWNVSQFKQVEKASFICSSTVRFFKKPQFCVENLSARDLEIWIFLERHISPQKASDTKIDVVDSPFRVLYPSQYSLIYKGDYSNSRCHLAKTVLGGHKKATIVIDAMECANQIYTMSVLSFLPQSLKISKSKAEFPTSRSISDSWSVDCSGGSWIYPTYLENPQYELFVMKPGKVCIILECDEEIPINLNVFFDSPRLVTFSQKNMANVEDGQKFEKHVKVSNLYLESGSYVLVPLALEPQSLAKFNLSVHTQDDFSIKRMSTELGLFVKSFVTDSKVYRVAFSLAKTSIVSIKALSLLRDASSSRKALKCTLFRGGQVLENEESSHFYGVYLLDMRLEEGEYVICIERENECGCKLEIGCSNSFEVR